MPDSENRVFGRRGAIPTAPPARPATVTAPANSRTRLANAVAIVRSPLGKQLLGILAGVGILVVLQLVYVVSMKGFGRALDRHWSENVGYPAIEDAYLRAPGGDASLERVHNNCKARSDFVTLDTSHRHALEGFDGLYSGESALARSATYLSCLMADHPPRFCQPEHRAHLAASLTDYYKLMRQVREERYLASTNPFAVEKSLLSTPSGGEAAAGVVPPPSAQSDRRVLDGLRTLISQGYLSRRDLSGTFGGLPGDLEVALRGVEAQRKACP